jgi:Peptidase C13 family
MQNVWSVLKLTAGAVVWRPTRMLQFVGLPSLLVCAVALAVVRLAFQFLGAGPGAGFNPYGLNALVAWVALDIAVAALFVPVAARATALSAMLALLVVAELLGNGLKVGAAYLPLPPALNNDRIISVAIFALVSLWWIGAMVAVLRTFTPRPNLTITSTAAKRLTVVGRAAGLWLALLVASALIPHAPTFIGRDFDINNANWWEILHARLEGGQQKTASGAAEAAPLEQTQKTLLKAQVAGLSPSTKGAPAVFALGIAGWSDDVFLKELDGGLNIMAAMLPIHGRTVRLINNQETLQSAPLADRRNFAAAVHAIAALMNKDDDVLLLLMTSHGEPTGFGLRLPNGAIGELTAQEVAATLNNEGIKNRVVIVSACYAGTFVPPLQNDNTIVLTAADAKNTSFGCAPERDWTYFGDALFHQSMRPGRDFQQAFDNARVLIEGWELMDRAPPSHPQGFFGPALVARLAPFLAAPPAAGQ